MGHLLLLSLIVILTVSSIGVLPNFMTITSVLAQESTEAMYPPDSQPFGLSHDEWSIMWWKWLNSIPRSSNPLTDTTGKNCNVQQYGPVWFLAGSNGVQVERSCDIPEGKALFFPIVNGEGSFAENPLITSEEQLRSGLVELIDEVSFIEAKVDGVKLENLQEHRFTTGLFNFTFPEDNDSGAPPGPTRGVSDGYWVMLHPLSAGPHEITFKGAIGNPTTTASLNFITDVTYHINVVQSDNAMQLSNHTILLGGQETAVATNSSSTISDFQFNEEDRSISFRVSGTNNTEDVTIVSLQRVMNGPYAVFIDGNSAAFESISDESGNETSLRLSYVDGTHNISIIGTSIVPEFPAIMIILIFTLGIGLIVGSFRKFFNR